MVPGGVSGRVFEAGWCQDLRGRVFVRPFCATWPILDDFGDPLKSKGTPKTSQKIQYGDFWASGSGPGGLKSCFWRGLKNALIFEQIFNGFWLDFGSLFGRFFMFVSLHFRD